ncbi:hypothetical protein [Novosphingobium sp. PASSN1]|uniref:hypothetical protein n=1 Tax=Novosphingobium sp. PASSN1 TaxID=2015561 RepID=UPI0025E1FD3C|nr:hypothetical protein [Novosphingobium sp. PASSN1]
MIRHALCTVTLLALCACNAAAPTPPPEPTGAKFASPPQPSPARPPSSRDPDVVLRAWGDAFEARDWVTARAFWGDQGARSGLTEEDFAARWAGLHYPKVTLAKGTSEGAAGSLYYTAPITITDGARVITGEIVLRRANDVDGATPEQLRWHIESTTLAP